MIGVRLPGPFWVAFSPLRGLARLLRWTFRWPGGGRRRNSSGRPTASRARATAEVTITFDGPWTTDEMEVITSRMARPGSTIRTVYRPGMSATAERTELRVRHQVPRPAGSQVRPQGGEPTNPSGRPRSGW